MKHKIVEDVRLPKGFRAAGIAAGLKKSRRKDLALIVSDAPAVMAGTFTTNQVKAAPVKLCRSRIASGARGRAIVINSGVANACTGAPGLRDAERTARIAAKALGVGENSVFICSTGRIGLRLPMDILEAGIRTAAASAAKSGGPSIAEAIMTTDTRPKKCTARLKVDGEAVTVTAFAKGAGMIEPNMATMLAFVLTDAAVERKALQACLSAAVAQSFNRITVDGDRSTNDTVLCMANGAAGNRPLRPGHPAWAAFCGAVNALTLKLALKIVEDGEGASKVVTVRVAGARNDKDADLAARAVANSLLVKTSWVGTYPNWGRIMDAMGYSDAKVDEGRVEIRYDGLLAVTRGVSAGAPLAKLEQVQRKKAFELDIDLGLGRGRAVVYTCNCTEEYVRINMD